VNKIVILGGFVYKTSVLVHAIQKILAVALKFVGKMVYAKNQNCAKIQMIVYLIVYVSGTIASIFAQRTLTVLEAVVVKSRLEFVPKQKDVYLIMIVTLGVYVIMRLVSTSVTGRIHAMETKPVMNLEFVEKLKSVLMI